MQNAKHIAIIVLCALLILSFFAAHLLLPDAAVSSSERRYLAQFPAPGIKAVFSGAYMEKFESYLLDQFPLRDGFRALKAALRLYVFGQLDSNGLFRVDGSVAATGALDEASVKRAAEKINKVIAQLPQGAHVYVSAIPDKSYYLAQGTLYPVPDFDRLEAVLAQNLADAQYVTIRGALGAGSYYSTDLHWKQTELAGVLETLGNAMGFRIDADFTQKELYPFYGAYAGQYALPLDADALSMLTNDILAGANVQVLDTKTLEMAESAMYDEALFSGVDPYSVYLSGPQAVVTIENPNAATDRQLYLFRDSFGNSIAPLLTEAYAKITLIDLRYISSDALFRLVDFDANADVLFLYGSMILNDSTLLLVK